MSKGFFLFMAVLYGALCWYCILSGREIDDYANLMFMLFLGIYSIMKLVEKRPA